MKPIKNRRFLSLIIALIFSGFGVAVGPELINGMADAGCEIVGCE